MGSHQSPSPLRTWDGLDDVKQQLAGMAGIAVRRPRAELAGRGVELLNGPVNRPWGVRTASFADPGGHIWEIAQELPRPGGS